MFAIAVSSDAIARAVKMAAAAYLRRSAGRPSISTGPLAEMISVDIRKLSNFSGCSADAGQPAGDTLHGAYANCLNVLRVEEAGSNRPRISIACKIAALQTMRSVRLLPQARVPSAMATPFETIVWPLTTPWVPNTDAVVLATQNGGPQWP
jgi:hypothetical protein